MPRLMSVSLTEGAVRKRTKTVTRRLGWRFLKPGERITLCRKVMGRAHGEPLVRITDVEVVTVRRERLDAITTEEVERIEWGRLRRCIMMARWSELRTSVRIVGERRVDEFAALCGVLGLRPHQFAAELVQQGVERYRSDPDLAPIVRLIVRGWRRSRAGFRVIDGGGGW